MSARFSVDLWDQFEEVYKRVNTGKQFTAAVVDFMHKRSQIEKEYSRKIQALCKTVEREFGTTLQGWNSLKEETENISKKHLEFSEHLQLQVEEPLANFLKDNKKPRSALKDQGRKLIRDLQSAEKNASSSKLAFEQSSKKQDETKDEYEKASQSGQPAKTVDALSKKLKMESKKASLADRKYAECVDILRNLQDKFYDEEMPRILEDFHTMEESRIDKTKKAFSSYVELQRSLSPEIQNCCERMNTQIQNINSNSDLQSFIAEKRTGAPKPERVVYENYSSELGRCVKGGSSVPVQSLTSTATKVSTISTPAVSSTTTPVSNPVTRSVNQPSPTQQPSANPGRGAIPSLRIIGKCRALYDYQATDSNELTFKQNDIINILQKDPSGWWQGELKGQIGVFPSVDWVVEVTEGSDSPLLSTSAPARKQCKALYDYTAENEYELTISAGDILTVERDEDGWFIGSNQHGKHGIFPSNYVELL